MLRNKFLLIPVSFYLGFSTTAFSEDEATPENEVTLTEIVVVGEIIKPGVVGIMPTQGGINDAAALLRQVPGANINSNGPLSGIAQYRGLFGDRINVSSDGANYKSACANAMDAPLSHVPTSLTEVLKIERGIASVSSGIETLGGSIVQETRKGEFAGSEKTLIEGKASSGYNSVNDGRYASVFINAANQNHKLRVGGSHEKGNSFEWAEGTNIDTRHERNASTFGYGFQTDDHEFDVGYNYNDTLLSGTPSLPMDIIYSRGGVPTFNYIGNFADQYEVTAKLQYQDIKHRMDNFTLRGIGLKTRQSDNTARGFGYKFTLAIPYLDGELLMGLDGDNIEHDALITDPFNGQFRINNFNDVNRDRYGFFTEWEGDVADNWGLELGGRINWVRMQAGDVFASTSKFTSGGTPINAPAKLQTAFNNSDRDEDNVNVDLVAIGRYFLSPTLDVEIGFARKTRSPTYQERYIWVPLTATGGLADGRNYIGTTNLDPEVSYQAELGFDWQEDAFYFAPRVFYRYVEDYIQGTPTTNNAALAIDPNTLQFTNVDAYLYGFDAEAEYQLNDTWKVGGIVSYVRGKRDDTDDDLYRIAPLNTTMKLTYETDIWMTSAEVVAYSRQNKVSSFNNEVPTSGYTTFNFRGQYRPQLQNMDGLEIGFGIENIFDKGYRVHLNGLNRNPLNEDTAIGEHLPGNGRNYYVTLSYDW